MRQFAQIAHRGAHGNQLDTLRGLSLSTAVAGVADVIGGVVGGVGGGVVTGVVGGGVGCGVVEMFYLGHQALQVCTSRGFT